MTSAFRPIADKLGKPLRMLTSSCDGEVLAATRRIDRTGIDIHVLADGVASDKKFTKADAVEIYQSGLADGRREAEQQQSAFRNVDNDASWHAIACECAAKSDRLYGQKKKDFVADIVRWTTHGGEPTEKQAKVCSIHVRARR
jgi:hypothetical protein